MKNAKQIVDNLFLINDCFIKQFYKIDNNYNTLINYFGDNIIHSQCDILSIRYANNTQGRKTLEINKFFPSISCFYIDYHFKTLNRIYLIKNNSNTIQYNSMIDQKCITKKNNDYICLSKMDDFHNLWLIYDDEEHFLNTYPKFIGGFFKSINNAFLYGNGKKLLLRKYCR